MVGTLQMRSHETRVRMYDGPPLPCACGKPRTTPLTYGMGLWKRSGAAKQSARTLGTGHSTCAVLLNDHGVARFGMHSRAEL